jgi:anti-sigma B factor antagonist
LGDHAINPPCYNITIHKYRKKQMEFSITEYKHCDLMKIKGRIDSYTSPIIDDAINALLTDGHYNIVIDMENVSYLSSSGILVFIHAQKLCKRQDRGEIVFANVSENIYSSLKLAGFHHIFRVYDSSASAVGHF